MPLALLSLAESATAGTNWFQDSSPVAAWPSPRLGKLRPLESFCLVGFGNRVIIRILNKQTKNAVFFCPGTQPQFALGGSLVGDEGIQTHRCSQPCPEEPEGKAGN